jgi:hypothetical protein
MGEQVYYDLTGEIKDIPAETWAGIDAGELIERMESLVPDGVEPSRTSLRTLASQMRTPRPSAEMRASRWVSPRLIQLIDERCDLEELGFDG